MFLICFFFPYLIVMSLDYYFSKERASLAIFWSLHTTQNLLRNICEWQISPTDRTRGNAAGDWVGSAPVNKFEKKIIS